MSNILLHSRGTCRPQVLPARSPSPPPGRGTSPWFAPASAPLPGPPPRPKGIPTGGATASPLAVSKWTSDNTSWRWASSMSLRAKWNCCQIPLHWVKMGEPDPTWDWCRGVRGMAFPHSDIFCNLCSCRWLGTESMVSLCQTMAMVTKCTVATISLLDQNTTTDSITDTLVHLCVCLSHTDT